MDTLQISLFGKFEVRTGRQQVVDVGSQKMRELLAYLLIFRDRPHYREELATLLWEDSSATQARGYLRQTLYHVQSLLKQSAGSENGLLQLESDWVRVDSRGEYWLDVASFEQAYSLCRGVPGRALDREKVQALQRAVALYRGNLLESWYQDWCIFERTRLQNTYLALLDKLLAYCESHGDYESGVEYATQILRADRAHEKTYRRLMRLQFLIGDRSNALRTYRLCLAELEADLGVAPSEQTTDLYRQIQNDRLEDSDASLFDALTGQAEASMLNFVLDQFIYLKDKLGDIQHKLETDIELIKAALLDSH
jgi:DNA-binding SARP family transcriptional activator